MLGNLSLVARLCLPKLILSNSHLLVKQKHGARPLFKIAGIRKLYVQRADRVVA